MIDVDAIRNILRQAKIYRKETDKNFICRCIYCGDHRRQEDAHGYISKDDRIPVFHCFLCNHSCTINKLLFDLTGDVHKDLVIPVESRKQIASKKKVLDYKLPELDTDGFINKTLYMKKRTINKMDVKDIPNLIFDIIEFFRLNNLNIQNYLTAFEQQYIQNNMVCFLSHRKTMLYCRAIGDDAFFKFKKIVLNKDSFGLDYYCIDNGHYESDLVVLSEGNFDILGCYGLDTLNLNDKARAYCSGCSFSYEELLKSVCVDFGIYKANVIVLSDSDKNKYHYKYFIQNSKPYVRTMKIYYNQYGKDFGTFPQKAVKLF